MKKRAYNETDLQRSSELRNELQDADPKAWSLKAANEMREMEEALAEFLDQEGGSLAYMLRQALEERIVQKVNGRAELTDDTREVSLSVHVLPNDVIVDVRLRVGVWTQ